jgi:UDP-N-acetylmuramoylalanine-D-glutamate ligase
VERREASERAEAILKLINEYRVYAHRFESLPTWDVLGFLNKLQDELFERFGRDVNN